MRIVIKGIGKPQQNTYDGGDDEDDDDDDESEFIDKFNHVSHIKKRRTLQAKKQAANEQEEDEEEEEDEQKAEIAGQSAIAAQNEQEQQEAEQQQQSQSEDGGGESGGESEDGEGDEKKGKLAQAKEKIGEMKGAFDDWKKKREHKKEMKQIRKATKKDSKKNPYHKNFIPEKHARNVYNEKKRESLPLEPIPQVVTQKDKLDEAREKKGKLAGEIQMRSRGGEEEYEMVKKLESDYKKADEEQKTAAKSLRTELLKADIRRSMQGPRGCAKTIASFRAIVLTVVGGGILTAILKLCGVF